MFEDQYSNRELAWLDFNARVLAIAESDATHPLERAKFIAIHSTNLDELYLVRVAGLKRQVEAGRSNGSVVICSQGDVIPDLHFPSSQVD